MPDDASSGLPRTLSEVRAFLSAHGLRPKKRFGQNFMIDRNVLERLADLAALSAGDRVLEVGTGTGLLTIELAKRGAEVVTVEADDDLAQAVHSRLDAIGVRGLGCDVLDGKHALDASVESVIAAWGDRGYKVVANLPYNVSVPFLQNLVSHAARPAAAWVTVQREVADRLVADAGTKAYGRVTVEMQLRARVRRLRDLPPTVFWPRPEVASSIVEFIVPPARLDPAPSDERAFRDFVVRVFSARRKTIAKTLGLSRDRVAPALRSAGIEAEARAEAVPPAGLVAAFGALRDAGLIR